MSFEYDKPLEAREIRLLEVVEGHDKDPLQVRLSTHEFEAAEFDALSYVWGDPSSKIEIHCNDLSFAVTDNLHAALLERRRRHITSPLWVDALCINQCDVDERTRQVRMMKNIYSRAKTVIIWLGPDVPHDDKGIDLARRIYEECHGSSFNIDNVRPGIRVDDFGFFRKGVSNPFVSFCIREPSWKSLIDMLSVVWFTRVWVIQELLVAKQSLMWRGKLNLDPKFILFAALLVDTNADFNTVFNYSLVSTACYNGSIVTTTCPAVDIATLYFRYRKTGPQSFWDTLCLCRNMQASDLRDRYFAIVGISTGLQYELVDYNKTLSEVHAQVGYISLSGRSDLGLNCRGLDLLAFGHYRDHASPVFGGLSWVPGLISTDRFDVTIAEAYPTADLCRIRSDYCAARPGIEFGFIMDTEQAQAITAAYPIPFVR